MTYDELVVAVGSGFHPDEYGCNMSKLPEGVDVLEYDRIVNRAHREHGARIYDYTMSIFIAQGWVRVES